MKYRRSIPFGETAEEMAVRLRLPVGVCREIIIARIDQRIKKANIAFDLAKEGGEQSAVVVFDGEGNMVVEPNSVPFTFDYDNNVQHPPVVEHYRARGNVRRSHTVPPNYRDRQDSWIVQPEALLMLAQSVDSAELDCVCSGWEPGQFSIPEYEHFMVRCQLRMGECPGYTFGIYLEGDIAWPNITGSEVSLDTFAIHHGETGDIAYLRMSRPEVIPPGQTLMLQAREGGLLGRVS